MSNKNHSHFDLLHCLHELKHYLPSQAPLKDFIHHNTLHAFQHHKFHNALHKATSIFGYRTYFNLTEYRRLYSQKQIYDTVLNKILSQHKPAEADLWKQKMLSQHYNEDNQPRIGRLRNQWKDVYKVNLDKEVHSTLFKIIGAFLDQGVSVWNMPTADVDFWNALVALESKSFNSFFKNSKIKKLLLESQCSVQDLLKMIVAEESHYEQYIFDQQFAHPGWSGMVSVLEDNENALLDKRQITLEEFIRLELLLELDVLETKFKGSIPKIYPAEDNVPLFDAVQKEELFEIYKLWQEAFEWSYYDQVLKGIKQADNLETTHNGKTFQAILCIDDREGSFRRYLEKLDPTCKTFGTPGFFNVDCYFKPANGKFVTKICPVPLSPKHLIKEVSTSKSLAKDAHFTRRSHSLLGGWLISLTLGFWSIIQLMLNIFRPSQNAMVVSSFRHMDKNATLTIENKDKNEVSDGLQVGFTVEEMTDRLEGLLRGIGLVENFAPLIYVIGHGASSVNNTHYAGYDCGACSGRPGSVNARAICHIGNHSEVRELLKKRGIEIPVETQFVGSLHETTRDEIEFYDEQVLSSQNAILHENNLRIFKEALDLNSKERSRRFNLIDSHAEPEKIHDKVKLRSVSLFEPRPELNHATNALCIVGRRELTDHLFLDRRAFMNSYDYKIDPEGKYLLGILRATAPVCGGINLEYYFSRVDPYRLGAGTKLPHNVMGLFGVANGMDGDLRTGLPTQMIEVHDPVRLMIIVEHFPEVVLKVIQINEATYEWFKNDWVHLVVISPDNHSFHHFKDGHFADYQPVSALLETKADLNDLIESNEENFPVYILNQ